MERIIGGENGRNGLKRKKFWRGVEWSGLLFLVGSVQKVILVSRWLVGMMWWIKEVSFIKAGELLYNSLVQQTQVEIKITETVMPGNMNGLNKSS